VASNRSNLISPNQIKTAVDLDNPLGWFREQLAPFEDAEVRFVALHVAEHLDAFVHFPDRALLLWPGSWRRPKQYHRYPDAMKAAAKQAGIQLDGRFNGPAIAAFLLAGGRRPQRFGSNNAWSVHHVYQGKYPYVGRGTSLHAVKDGKHFTQSAGLVAVHPFADQMADEYPAFAWLLRAEAFRRFGYDPDHVFGDDHDEYGFVPGHDRAINPFATPPPTVE